MRSDFVDIHGKKLHYLQWGRGKRLMLAFHGYSNNARLFNCFEPLLAQRYTVVSVDLPFHGHSDWLQAGTLLPEDLLALATHFRQAFGTERFSLMGFSLGGRVSLYLTQQMPEQVEQVVLMAPDGLAFNPFYYFVTRTWPGRQFFGNMLSSPRRYFRIIEALHRRRWLDPSRYRFLMNYLETPQARTFLGQVWPSLRYLLPEKKKVQAAIRQYGIPVHLYMGRYDRVIPLKLGREFAKGVAGVQLHVLEKGHRLVDSETASLVASQLR